MEALEHMQRQMAAALQRIEHKFQEQLKEERIKAEKREQKLLLKLKQMRTQLVGVEDGLTSCCSLCLREIEV